MRINSIFEISERFDGFIIDLWGVVHDGSELYEGVPEILHKLRSQNKRIVFLSNAPRRASIAEEKLNKFGIDKSLYDGLLTSGEAAFHYLKTRQDDWKKYYYIGPERDEGLTKSLSFIRVNNPGEADFIITTGFEDDHSDKEEKLPKLKECRTYDLPMICCNPDMFIVRKSGKKAWCAGVFGEQYEQLGGEVIYFGKPYRAVYEESLKILGLEKGKVAAIGDNLDTDIKGANESGICSVLVTGGVLSVEIQPNNKLPVSEEQILAELKKRSILPTYYILGELV